MKMYIKIVGSHSTFEISSADCSFSVEEWRLVQAMLAPLTPPQNVILHLDAVGLSKINAIKAIRTITGKGLAESKDIAEGPMPYVFGAMTPTVAECNAKLLQEAGCRYTVL